MSPDKKGALVKKLIAYDLETTRIEAGTPEVLYLTCYGDGEDIDNPYKISIPVTGKNKKQIFCEILEQHLLTEKNDGARFVAWNGNKFDAYFIVEALLQSDRWIMQPYMTASKSVRGVKVKERDTEMRKKYERVNGKVKRVKPLKFEFLDGMAMTGIAAPLKNFLKTFAPKYQKMVSPDFEGGEKFDPNNKKHVQYAERDSEGLYHAMKKVSDIVADLTGEELKPTVGNLAIHHFINNVPPGIELKLPEKRVAEHLYGPLKKGGYCWAAQQYTGPVWKYDINQAYASAMRDAALPCGDVVHDNNYEPNRPGIYQVEIERKRKCKVPFYYKDENGTGKFSQGNKAICWITSLEIDHLRADEWNVEVFTGYYWSGSFNMQPFVDKLEKLRSTDKDGPSGPLGTLVKALGNNAYGKFLEQIWGDEFVLSKDCPEGYTLYDSFDPKMNHVFARERKSFPKKYHVPQIGVFITAYVRCVVRDAAKHDAENFLYADTDCVAFRRKARHLHLDPARYGSWKTESAGTEHIIIGKKMYFDVEKNRATFKGLIVKRLTKKDVEDYLKGKIIVQDQVQRQNLLKFIGGEPMFKNLTRRGTDVSKLKNVQIVKGEFIPT